MAFCAHLRMFHCHGASIVHQDGADMRKDKCMAQLQSVDIDGHSTAHLQFSIAGVPQETTASSAEHVFEMEDMCEDMAHQLADSLGKRRYKADWKPEHAARLARRSGQLHPRRQAWGSLPHGMGTCWLS